MATHLVRKQIYIQKRQEALLKRLSRARGISEAELIRRALENELAGGDFHPTEGDAQALEEFIQMARETPVGKTGEKPYRWNREEIYSEREQRYLREQDQE